MRLGSRQGHVDRRTQTHVADRIRGPGAQLMDSGSSGAREPAGAERLSGVDTKGCAVHQEFDLRHTLVVAHIGYAPKSAVVTVAEGQALSLSVFLVAEEVEVELSREAYLKESVQVGESVHFRPRQARVFLEDTAAGPSDYSI